MPPATAPTPIAPATPVATPAPFRGHCRACGYALHTLPKGNCPECGRPFDPADPRSFRRTPRSRAWKYVRRTTYALLALALLLYVPAAYVHYPHRAEQAALARLKSPERLRTAPLGPPGLQKAVKRYLGQRAADRLERVRALRLDSDAAVGNLDALAAFTRLEELDVSLNRSKPEDLAHVARCPTLRSLTIRGTQVTAAHARHLTALTNLAYLEIHCAPTDADAFAHFATLPKLTTLNLYGAMITDGAMPHIGRMTNLRTLDLRYARVTDAAMIHLAPLKELQRLDLSQTGLTDAAVAHAARLPRLSSITLPRRATDLSLSYLADCWTLDAIDARHSGVSDDGLAHLSRMYSLRTLNLYGCDAVRGPGLSHLAHLTGLRTLNLPTSMDESALNDLRKPLPSLDLRRSAW